MLLYPSRSCFQFSVKQVLGAFLHVLLQAPSMLLVGVHCPGIRASQAALVVKSPPANAGDIRDAGSIPGSGRSHGGGHGHPL